MLRSSANQPGGGADSLPRGRGGELLLQLLCGFQVPLECRPHLLHEGLELRELSLSRAYAPLLRYLVRELGDRLSDKELEHLFTAVGRRWGAELPHAPGVAHAAMLLEQLGAAVEVERGDTAVVIRGHGCPLGLAVQDQPHLCAAVEAMLSAVVGTKVRERCDRSGTPSCRFVLGRPA
ncbi:MAG: hypothetical protein ACREOQ_20460 [Gemmatimonadales bacterium]